MEMLDDNQIDVQCKFNPPMDITKTPTMEENFVGNVTQMIMSLIYANGNIKEQTNEKWRRNKGKIDTSKRPP